jgi:hypothetical protein
MGALRSAQCLLAVAVLACHRSAPVPQQVSPPAAAAVDAARDSIQRINDRMEAAVLARIAGHEREPASQVFSNITLPHLRNVPAANLVGIVNGGYAKALGVTCTHCHVAGNFASDDKRPKRAEREMAMMHFGINQQLLKMENLATQPPQDRFINCMTCHRGAVNPRSPG